MNKSQDYSNIRIKKTITYSTEYFNKIAIVALVEARFWILNSSMRATTKADVSNDNLCIHNIYVRQQERQIKLKVLKNVVYYKCITMWSGSPSSHVEQS